MASTGTDLSTAVWRKSSYSNGSGGECVEVAVTHPGAVIPVRDSKRDGEGPVLLFPAPAWAAFVVELVR
ncbi:DUF397 domain-containing protein [Streptomyces sp. NPDC096040]|uniref:DUF397 domain-containing protein n=1 Tax=Streptomyces sp. NPDC096040 TaxID=3155541 RepID=UPI00331E506F